jgi:localization factor PodJL
MSLGEWLNSVILDQAEESGLLHAQNHGDDDASYAHELAGVHQRLDDITRRLERFARPGPEAYAPKHSRSEEPDRIAELIARLDRRLEQFVEAARPAAAPAAYVQVASAPAYAPPPRTQPQPQPQAWATAAAPMPNVQLPPALDRAIAEITARQRALNRPDAAPLPPRPPFMAPPPPAQFAPPPFVPPASAPPPRYAPPAPPRAYLAATPAPAPAPVPAQDLSGLEEQLRRITDQIETLRRPGVEEAIGALRAELKEIGRALNDALPRRELEAIEAQIQELNRRIAEGRQNGADSGALAGVEHGLAEVRDALRGLTPAENLVGFHEAIDALARKIDLIVAQKDPATLHQLEYAITTLRDMAAHVASDDALRKLAAELQRLGDKVEQMSVAAPASDALANLEHRIEALSQALAERAQNGTVVPPRLEALVQSLSDKIEQIQQSRGDSLAVGHLEDRIVTLVERLDASDTRLNHLEAIERGLGDLLVSIQDMRAARHGDAQAAQSQPGVDALKHDIARTQTALDAVHGTLGHVVDRLASIEKDIRGEGRRRPAPEPDMLELTQPVGPVAVRAVSDAPPIAPPMPSAAPAPVRVAAPPAAAPVVAAPPPQRRAAPAKHGPIDPDLPPDQPLEPGSGPPRQRAGARIAASEAALGAARPAQPAGGKSTFIAAARRAAQAAVQEVGPYPPSVPETRSTETPVEPTLPGRMMSRVKAIFIAASIAAVAVGGVQLMGGIFNRGPQTPAVKTANTLEPNDKAPLAKSVGRAEIASPTAPQTAASITSVPAAGNLATELPSLDIGQSGYNMPSGMPSLLSPPALNPQPQAASNDITGSIPQPTAVSPGARTPAAPLSLTAGSLPAGIGGSRLRVAAAAGDGAAAYEVAVRYAEGRGVPSNLPEAARWYQRAAAKGITLAQFRYASFLEKGQGVKKDLPAARRLYLAAAAKGNAKAMHNIAVLYAEGVDGKPDYATAAQWFQKAAQHGVADSQYNLGVLAARGLGLEKSLIDSYKWFALAAAQGDKEAGRKRDEVARQLDPQTLARAQHAVKSFVAVPQPHDAISVRVPPGGWDDPAGKSNAQGKARPAHPTALGAYRVGKR